MYTNHFGHHVRRGDSIDIDPSCNPTFLCDLAQADRVIPPESYDCILLTNALFTLRDIEPCLSSALRLTKPGGVILASNGTFVPLIPDYDADYWRMSAAGWKVIVDRALPGCGAKVESHGNCLAAVAAMLGLAFEELSTAELDVFDPRYPVLITVFCRKPGCAGTTRQLRT